MAGGSRRQSGDVRLGDTLLGLPCLQRQRANLTGGLRETGEMQHGETCPVCGMETDELVLKEEMLENMGVVGRVQERFPGWQPEDGLCRPCLGLFGETGS
ncbi:hypothetical protein [Geomonas edaphica]|uniref:hypothetical protein n=1 Tax=Geomonas edaphica TaxID=2570226 RepID=UPI0010A7720D|nr:hypothetical protein [Geomonas edaphica]